MDEIFRTAFYQRHNVALNVGSDNFSNRISFAYDNDEGVLINTFKKNLTLRYNGKMQLNKWVSVSEDFVWQNTTQRSKATDNDAYTGPILSAIYMPASATVYNPVSYTHLDVYKRQEFVHIFAELSQFIKFVSTDSEQ